MSQCYKLEILRAFQFHENHCQPPHWIFGVFFDYRLAIYLLNQSRWGRYRISFFFFSKIAKLSFLARANFSSSKTILFLTLLLQFLTILDERRRDATVLSLRINWFKSYVALKFGTLDLLCVLFQRDKFRRQILSLI